MACALCKLNNELRNSHIVPEFMYKEMYDSTHKFSVVSRQITDANRQFRKGLHEYLLCSDCESKLSRWESYAASFFYGKKIMVKRDGDLFFYESLKYNELKLFFLSLLWRFSVTSLPELQGAKLPEKHREKLRKSLLNEDPGVPLFFPCHIIRIIHKRKFLVDFISPPMSAKLDAHHVWQFAVAGYYFMFFVSSHPVINDLKITFLTKEGKMISMAQELAEIKPLYEFCMDLASASIQRKRIPKSQLNWRRIAG